MAIDWCREQAESNEMKGALNEETSHSFVGENTGSGGSEPNGSTNALVAQAQPMIFTVLTPMVSTQGSAGDLGITEAYHDIQKFK
jgi:hypothetical protein